MIRFGALNWFDSFIKQLLKSIGLYQSRDLDLCIGHQGCPVIDGWSRLLTSYICIVGIPPDQNSPKSRYTANIWNLAYYKSDSLLYWDISRTHLTYEQV